MKLLFILSIFSLNAAAMTFHEAVKVIELHESVEEIKFQSKAYDNVAEIKSSWGDPQFKFAAKNFPSENFKNDQSAMTGIEFGISQKVSLSSKFSNIKNSIESISDAYEFEAKDRKTVLIKHLWETLILRRKISLEIEIFSENINWISNIIKISNRLYSTGKISQQAILDVQIRKSEILRELNNKKIEKSQVEDQLIYLIGSKSVDDNTIPWAMLSTQSKEKEDYKELSLKALVMSKDFAVTAAKLNLIPDLTISLGYTKRYNIDGNGDFVGATLSIPIPLGSEKYSEHLKSVNERYVALKKIANYQKNKSKEISIISKEINKLSEEIKIIRDETIRFAKNSRDITAKSYSLGSSTYVELLQSEIKLQKILMQKVMLEANRDVKRISLRYVKGEPLYEL